MYDVDVAAVAALLGNPSRATMLDALMTGRALTATELARAAEVSPATASEHLARLREGGLVEVVSQGRHRYHRLASPDVGAALEALSHIAPAKPVTTLRQSSRARSLAEARTCYDHLAGTAGVRALDWFLEHGWLTPLPEGRRFQLTAAGESGFEREGVDVGAARRARRAFAIGCDDWTERRFHLGGALGSELLAALLRSGRARLEPGSRVVEMSEVPWPA